MTSLVANRRPLEVLSMNNHSERRSSKRLAATANFEEDDDFQFVRKSKRAKTNENAVDKTTAGKGRSATQPRAATTVAIPPEPDTTASSKPVRKTRRRPQTDASQTEVAVKSTGKTTRRTARAVEEDEIAEANPTENDASEASARKPPRAKEKAARKVKNFDDSPVHEPSVQSAKIALPMSDTPIINRNKEMRKKGSSNRRSSLGTRGRRASSLIENGQSAIPHRDVNPAEFFKHIAEGLPEPRRMKQLLTWCGERSLAAKPPLGTPNANAILGARAIQDQLLKDFASRSDFSDWFSRDDDPQKPPVVLRPNPRNMELSEKTATLEEKIKRLQEEKKAWLAIQKPPPDHEPLFAPTETDKIELPNFDLLDADDGKIRGYLADESNSSRALRAQTEARLQGVQASLEFQVDQLADNIHKLMQRVSVAGREADGVLILGAARLKEREQREKKSAGTRDMPIMEVLRGLSSILPEGDG